MTRPIIGLHAPDTARIPRARMVQGPLEDTLTPIPSWCEEIVRLIWIAALAAALWLLCWAFS